jgi:hypothetical protein
VNEMCFFFFFCSFLFLCFRVKGSKDEEFLVLLFINSVADGWVGGYLSLSNMPSCSPRTLSKNFLER